ncbi:MAG TPA: NADH:flavin oxidoreductase [Thermodesulfobacteriota bacterium]|nr:NADH:flavin oxidoreductase [Thermodesulfobacteriota bacterium]
MNVLFESSQIGGLTLSNRFVCSATWDGCANADGYCTQRNIDMLMERVRGGVGLIITGMAFVKLEGRAAPGQLGVNDDGHIKGLANMASAIHNAGGKVLLQLAHGGCYAPPALNGHEALGPSTNHTERFPACREMTVQEISHVVEAFGKAAGRARQAGFDGVQLHGAHGYLLSQFLSPFFNKRTDNYSGSVENRARILLEAFWAVRNEVGDNYPVFVKINSEDFVEGGLTVDEMLLVCSMLERAGVGAIELSGGTVYASVAYSCFRVGVPAQDREIYYKEAARRYKENIHVLLLLVGGIRSPEVAESVVGTGLADYISLCRPLICEPNLIDRWKAGDTGPATCKYCNGCFGPVIKGEGLRCILPTENR